MQTAKHRWLWNGVFMGIVLMLAGGIYWSSKSIDYNWRWERVLPYIVDTSPQSIRAPFDGRAELGDDGRTLTLISDYGDAPLLLNQYSTLLVTDGDLLFEGDEIARINSVRTGPIANGMAMTLQLSVVSLLCSVVLGLGIGLGRLSANPALRKLCILYIEIIRGTPLLVQIFIIYFFVGTVLSLDRFTAGAAALTLFSAAYVAEIIRAGIQSVPTGQMEAARSLGMSYVRAMVEVILPQALRRSLPSLAGQFINLIKDSSLVSVISLTDLSKAGREVVSSTFAPFEVWFTIALLYLVMTASLSWLVQRLERHMATAH
ncbi:amino acid ABC transporter permease [Oceanisphaera psychrotolerans]|uniref:Putative glutamine transport system permease protein GlnP n=1 Tax=Oceanisphaera psychrotolerans TaxID=1414654 RepID=A0A1J4QIH3_9GAMM|nr:amino acid ABC transporter permease [Oceanisphaera psychrotolerans]OIN14369.1 ABC transporter permease [Oceanisphaera psychrotolerans]